MTIKPEDISDEAFDKMADDVWTDFGMDKQDAANLLNAAIEAGVVSPPCWETKFTDFRSESVFKEKDNAIRHARHFFNCEVRHWKGQTE